jgi:TetR/AcrR family transcriptional regulator, cholesterol catabolism regulator
MPTTNQVKRRRKVTSNAEVRRQEILDEASELFSRLGYANVSMEDIAESSGIGKATLYHYFSSREDILFAMHEVIAEELLAHAEQVRSAGMTVEESIRSLILNMLRMIRDRRGYVRVFFEHYHELSPSLQRKIIAKRNKYAQFMEDLVVAGVASGSVRKVDPHLAMFTIFGMTNWAYQWYRATGDLTVDEIADFFVETLFKGIGNP